MRDRITGKGERAVASQALINSYSEITMEEIRSSNIIFDWSVRGLCKKAYGSNRNGCPNFGKPLCPPDSPYLAHIVDEYEAFTLVINTLDMENYEKVVLENHPDWTSKQARNSRHWQGAAHKRLAYHIECRVGRCRRPFVLGCGSGFSVHGELVQSMESSGINVTATFASAFPGQHLEWPPVKYLRKIALVCENWDVV